MTEPKTTPNDNDVVGFLNHIEDETKRQDCFTLLEVMRQATKCEPKMWGDSIVGFDSYHYKYESGREGDSPIVGFSPRKQNLTLYIVGGFDQYGELLSKLGKHTTGKACLYIKRIKDIDLPTLKKLVQASVEHMMNTTSRVLSE